MVIRIEAALVSTEPSQDDAFAVDIPPWVNAALDSWVGISGQTALGLRVLTDVLYPILYQPPTTPITIEEIKLTADVEMVENAVFRNLRHLAQRWVQAVGRMWITELEHDIMTIERDVVQSPFAMSVASTKFGETEYIRNERWIQAETQRRLRLKGIHLGLKEIEDYLAVIDSVYTLADNAGVDVEVRKSQRIAVYKAA